MKQIKNLIKVQNELAAPKNLTNKFGGYQYRSAEGILEKLKPLLLKYGLQLTMSSDIEAVDFSISKDSTKDKSKSGSETDQHGVMRKEADNKDFLSEGSTRNGFAKVVVTSTLVDSEGNSLVSSASAFIDVDKKGMDYAQACGASESYAKKYLLGDVFLIDDSSLDPDANNTHGKKQNAGRPATRTYRK